MKELGTIVTTSAAKQISEQIRQAILDGHIQKNEQLPTESDLATQFGVSRPTIREALKRLAAQNLIRSRRGPTGGTFVNNYQVEDAGELLTTSTMLMVSLGSVKLEEITSVRLTMELECCKAAIGNWSDATMHKLDAALARQSDAALSDEEFCDADVAFHRVIVDAGDNAMMRYIMYSVIEALVPVMNMMVVYVRDRAEILGFHKRIRDALVDQSLDDVRAALEDLMEYLSAKHVEAREHREKRKATAGI